jgi:hypothetical protein
LTNSGCFIDYEGVKRISPPSRAAIIDEYGELERAIAAFKPAAQRKAELEKEIASWYEDGPAEAEFTAEGRLYRVLVSPKALKRPIFDMSKLFNLLGKAKFLQVCSVPVGAIDREIPPEKHSAFLGEERTGRRGVESVARVPVARAA